MKISQVKHNIIDVSVYSYDLSGAINNTELTRSIENTPQRDPVKEGNDSISFLIATSANEDVEVDMNNVHVKKLLKSVKKVFSSCVDKEFAIHDFNAWAHMLEPKEQTLFHNHSTPSSGLWVMSWCYYVKVPEHSGKIVFVPDYHSFQTVIEPKESHLIVFPGWMNHWTTKNMSDENRISISGNVWIHPKMREEPSQSLLNHLGEYVFKKMNEYVL
jgi:hypothetical protein